MERKNGRGKFRPGKIKGDRKAPGKILGDGKGAGKIEKGRKAPGPEKLAETEKARPEKSDREKAPTVRPAKIARPEARRAGRGEGADGPPTAAGADTGGAGQIAPTVPAAACLDPGRPPDQPRPAPEIVRSARQTPPGRTPGASSAPG